MPKLLELKLRREVEKKHPEWSKGRKDAYIFGTMYKLGWRKGNKKDVKKLS